MARPLTVAALTLCLVLIANPALAQSKRPAGVPKGTKVTKDLAYAKVGDMALKLDLYVPPPKKDAAGKKQLPKLVVWIHGGGWRNGSKDRCPFAWLSGYGFAVASVQYRLTDVAAFPAQIHDCKGAIRWLRANASKHGYDAERVGALGISAGGHLVALLATSGDVKELEGKVGGNLDQSSRVQAVVDMCGPSDFLLIHKRRKGKSNPNGSIERLLRDPSKEMKEWAKLASPVTHVSKDDPPIRIVHGTKDPLVALEQAKRMHEVYQKAGLSSDLDIIEGGGHVPKEFWDQKRRDAMIKLFREELSPRPAKVLP